MAPRKVNDYLTNYIDMESIKQINCCGKFEKMAFRV